VTADSYTATFFVIGVWKKTDPGVAGATIRPDGNYAMHYEDNPDYFKGAEYCMMGIGSDWKGGGEPSDVDLTAAKACAPITGSHVTLTLKNESAANIKSDAPEGDYYQPAVFYIKLADGSQIIGGHMGWPDGPYMVKTRTSSVTGWLVMNSKGKVIPPSPYFREIAKAAIK